MKTYAPFIANEQPAPAGQSDAAAEFVRLWLDVLPPERRALVRADSRLMRCAEQHAQYLASRTPEEIAERAHVPNATHYGRDWSTPNERVRASGYRLPREYPEKGNHVESNATTCVDAKQALAVLLKSDSHRPHLLGEVGFTDRVVYGCGNSGSAWVYLGCPPEP